MSDFILQDPDALVIHNFDFTDDFESPVTFDSFASSVLPTGPTLSDVAIATGVAPVKVSGLVFAKTYRIEVQATMSNGEVFTQTKVLRGG